MTAADATVRLRPVTPDEFPSLISASTAGYAHGIEAHGGQAHDAAQRKAVADTAAALPQGLATPGHHLFVVEADGQDVGRLWLAERESGGRRVLFVYDVSIHPEHQGRGYARRAMQLAEVEARSRGIGRVELNVFGGNAVARGLYRSLGYTETSVQMAKELAGP